MGEKSVNKIWKESGTTLSFKEWIERENRKKEDTTENFMPFVSSTKIEPLIDTTRINETIGADKGKGTSKTEVLGLNKNILVFSGLIIAVSLGYFVYTKIKKNNA